MGGGAFLSTCVIMLDTVIRGRLSRAKVKIFAKIVLAK